MSVARVEDVARLDEVWGSPDAWVSNGLQWTHLDAINRMINRHVTGREDTSGLDVFFARLAAGGLLPLKRVLVLACGTSGQLEAVLARPGRTEAILAVDLSPAGVAHAREAAARRGLDTVEYQVADMNRLAVEGPFDAVFALSALHHCAELEALFTAIQSLLTPEGWFYIEDYIGPSRFQWTDRQVLQINRLLQSLPDRLVTTARGVLKRGFHRVPPHVIADYDPSEAVRSAEILTLLPRYFRIEEQKGFGGGLLQLLLSEIAQNFDPAHSGPADGPEFLRLLIETSDRLRASGTIPDDFAYVLARPPALTSQRAS